MDEYDFFKHEYKEFLVHGELVGKWVGLCGVSEYNKNGELIHEIFFARENWYNYDSHGNCIFEKWKTLRSEMGNNGVPHICYDVPPDITIYTYELKYDQKGNLIYKECLNPMNPKDCSKCFFEYDSNGKKTKERIESSNIKFLTQRCYTYDKQGRLIHEVDVFNSPGYNQKSELKFEYDDCGRVVCEHHDDGYKILYEYDENGNKSYMNSIANDGESSHSFYTYEFWDNGKPRKVFEYSGI